MAMAVKTVQEREKVLIFASGEKEPGKGGSGFKELVEFTRTDPVILDADIVGVVSNHKNGGVRTKADELEIPFRHFNGPYTPDNYKAIVEEFDAVWVMCSGWLKRVCGLKPAHTLNIHPAFDLERFGGKGMWGHHVHEAVIAAYARGEVTQSGVCMHFVEDYEDPRYEGKDPYDKGPAFFRFPVLIRPGETAETLASRVNEKERAWQAKMLNEVIHGRIWYVDHQRVHFMPEAIRIGV